LVHGLLKRPEKIVCASEADVARVVALVASKKIVLDM
jgi:hypothetical protein